MRAPPPPEAKPAPDAYGQQGAYEQDPYASNQGGYQPDYSQQGYNQVISQSGSVKPSSLEFALEYRIQPF